MTHEIATVAGWRPEKLFPVTVSDTIARITVSTVINSGQIFPLTTRNPFRFSVELPVIVHRFDSFDAKHKQRYIASASARASSGSSDRT